MYYDRYVNYWPNIITNNLTITNEFKPKKTLDISEKLRCFNEGFGLM